MGTHAEQLRNKIESKQALVAIIGLGYVGLPLLAAFHEAGYPVLGFDIDPEKPVLLKKGENYLPHLGSDMCKPFVGSKRLDATTDPKALQKADAIIVCVPTPLGQHGEPDLSYVVNTGVMIGENSREGQLVVLESTLLPRHHPRGHAPRDDQGRRQEGPHPQAGRQHLRRLQPRAARTRAARATPRPPSPSSSAASTRSPANWPPSSTPAPSKLSSR